MSTNKPDISQIQKYLNGELDAHAMHKLERQALDDAFLADALEGYAYAGKNQQHNLQDLNNRLQQRTKQKAKRIALWPGVAIAASVLLFLSVGSWWLLNYRAPANTPDGIPADKTVVAARPLVIERKKMQPKPDSAMLRQAGTPTAKPQMRTSTAKTVAPKTTLWGQMPQQDAINSEPAAAAPALSLVPQGRLVVDSAVAFSNVARNKQPDIRIRGLNTVVAGKPLYVVDGKVYTGNLANIDQAAIESLAVFKDASATAMYGSRGANGVIVVTTKKNKGVKSALDTNLLAKNQLKEVVIMGYPVQHKKDIAASVTTLAPVSVDQALQGRAAGVNVGTAESKSEVSLKTVTGQVLSENDGKPLPGVSIQLSKKSKGVLTDANGNFRLAASDNDELTISSVGYLSKRVKLKGHDHISVQLEEDRSSLSEVVAVGYGANKKPINKAHPVNGWENFKKYVEREAGLLAESGTVRISFTVNPDKTLTDFRIIKSVSAGTNQKAVTIIKNGPQWLPNVNGKPEKVEVKIKFP